MKKKEWNPDKIVDALTMKAMALKRPLSATFELTYRCNFRCPMCYVRMTDEQAAPYGRMRTVDEWLDMARQLKEAGVLYLNLTGGECTQYPGFMELYPRLCELGFGISIMTNGGAYSEALRSMFRQYPPRAVNITLYGASNETYGLVTGDPRGFDKTLDTIRFFQDMGAQMHLAYTAIKQNVHDLPKVGAVCAELGLGFSLTTELIPHLRNPAFNQREACQLSLGEQTIIWTTPSQELEAALPNAAEVGKKLECFTLPSVNSSGEPILNACVGSATSCAILWNGEMAPCLYFTGKRKYKPFEVGFAAAWQQMQQDRERTFEMAAQCKGCDMRETCGTLCPGQCAAITGDPQTASAAHCKQMWLRQQRGNNTAATPAHNC